MKNDSSFSRGPRAPGPVPGKGAWANIQDVRKVAHTLENKLGVLLIDGPEKDHALLMLDAALSYAEAIICRYDRNGPPEGLDEVGEMEATLRVIRRHPAQFAGFDAEGMKSEIAKLKGEKVAPKKK